MNISRYFVIKQFLIFTVVIQMLQMQVQGGSYMTGTDLYVNKPHCAAAVRP